MARVFIIILVVALSIYAIIDVARTDSDSLPARLNKATWLALVFFVPVIGPGIWLYMKYQHVFKSDTTFSTDDLRNHFPSSGPTRRKPKGPVAPDEDPDFLARLDAQNRRRAWEAQRRAEEGLDDQDDEDTGTDPDGKNAPKDDRGDGEGGLYGNR